ncbi:LuxR family transcriptional regulator [Pseudarthrobacter equi]|uniref:helix-turn-helix transcriptional regulator n=1 Tax=Pseudarthrobacter equi TaxID=728066 RepID=UPI0021C4E966|nr:LuxR family transcriptional regulator [Pseudarthrobacter equi]
MAGVLTREALVGRSGIMAAVTDCLLDRNGPGVLVLGDAGLGKTAVINAVIQELGNRVRSFRVFAGATLAGVPFAALAPLMTSLSPGQINEPLAVLKALSAALNPGNEPSSVPAVLVVEDAQHLDDGSTAVLAQLTASDVAKVVFICRPHPAPSGEILSMWSEGLLDRFDLQPLNGHDVAELCAQVMGAPVVPSAAAVLRKASGGNPMFLLELIEHARNAGQLINRNGAWMLASELRGNSLRLLDLVRNQIIHLDRAQREALDTVALAEPVPLDVLRQAGDHYAVDELQEMRLISIDSDAAQHVRIAQPLVGEVLRQIVPAARSLKIRQCVLQLMDTRPETMDGLLRYVSWGLEAGAKVPDQDILEAAQLANRLFIPSYVERVAGAIKDPALKLAAQVEVARARWYRGDVRGTAWQLGGIIERTNDPATLRQVSMLAAQLARRQGVGANAVKQAAYEWEAALARLAESKSGISEADLSIGRNGCRLLILEGMQAEGRHVETERELRQIWQQTGDPETRLLAGTLLGEAMAVTGRPLSALQLLGSVQDILDAAGHWGLQYSGFFKRRYLLALTHAGEFRVLEEYLRSHVSQAPNSLIYDGGMLHFHGGLADLLRGDVGSALPRLRQAVSMLRVSDMQSDLPEASAAAAYAASLLKFRDVAVTYSAEYDALVREGMEPSLSAQAHAAMATMEHVGLRQTLTRLTHLADAAAANGAVGPEINILLLVLRLGDLSVTRRLISLTETCEGRTAEFALKYSQALNAKDAAGLVALSGDAAEEGLELAAADYASHALRILESRGDKARQLEAQRLVKRRTAALGRAVPPSHKDLPDLSKLTRREQEIVALVQTGSSNRDIALSLGLSLRTVEGHLYRMFAKLGIGHRDKLIRPPRSFEEPV